MDKKPTSVKGAPSDATQPQPTTQEAFNDSKVVRSSQIAGLWEAKDPNAHAQELFNNWLHSESQMRKEDLNKWDECESRFEPAELKWIGNFIVNNLVFCRELGLEDNASAHVM